MTTATTAKQIRGEYSFLTTYDQNVSAESPHFQGAFK